MTAALALLSSVLWGTADFLGGTVSRRYPALVVVGASQAAGLLTITVVAALAGAFDDPRGYVGWAVLAGLTGLVGLVAFYAALAGGTMGVVAPIAALGVVVPVVVGLLRGDDPSSLQLAGIATAVAGVVLASGPEMSGRARARPVLLALVAAIGFGCALLFIAEGSRSSTLMTLVVMRVTSVSLVAAVALSARSTGGLTPAALPLVAVIGVGDVFANLAYGIATESGLVSIVAVLGSLYPVATVLLARLVHGERLSGAQNAGVATALAGVGLIAAGGGTG